MGNQHDEINRHSPVFLGEASRTRGPLVLLAGGGGKMEILKALDLLFAVFGFFYAIGCAMTGRYDKAIFWMLLATNCEIGYRLAE